MSKFEDVSEGHCEKIACVDADAHTYVDDARKFGNGFLLGIEYDRIILPSG